ncbi:hypothetical protein [Motilibacter deserti]|uniref:Uncharacterized protein n=1 Tax=Motilibacter deserti TaxID=2714956 RepID=A0ABX0GZF2_9ACTN|nr:hypothetical protein [Motilibacter deserti]NHC15953.1 hypothetical protein [Motilibacter deserti]
MALYLRDLAGVGPYVLPDLPPLVPPVECAGDELDLGAAIREWERWWASMDVRLPGLLPMPRPPDWGGLEDAPTLRALLERRFPEAEAWVQGAKAAAAGRRRSLHLTHFVNGFEQRLGRPVRPFRLWVGEVPVRGSAGWTLDDGHVLVSSELATDESELEAFLAPLIQAVA